MDPRTAKRKGTETESRWVSFLVENGVPNAERRRLSGSDDKGDIAGWVRGDGTYPVCSEVKSGAKLQPQQWLREAAEEKINSNSDTTHVIVRPKGKPNVEDWFVLLSVQEFMELMKKAGFIPNA